MLGHFNAIKTWVEHTSHLLLSSLACGWNKGHEWLQNRGREDKPLHPWPAQMRAQFTTGRKINQVSIITLVLCYLERAFVFVVSARGTPQWSIANRLASLGPRPFVVSWLSPIHFHLNANFISVPLKETDISIKANALRLFCMEVSLSMMHPVWKPANLLSQAWMFADFNSTLLHLVSYNI